MPKKSIVTLEKEMDQALDKELEEQKHEFDLFRKKIANMKNKPFNEWCILLDRIEYILKNIEPLEEKITLRFAKAKRSRKKDAKSDIEKYARAHASLLDVKQTLQSSFDELCQAALDYLNNLIDENKSKNSSQLDTITIKKIEDTVQLIEFISEDIQILITNALTNKIHVDKETKKRIQGFMEYSKALDKTLSKLESYPSLFNKTNLVQYKGVQHAIQEISTQYKSIEKPKIGAHRMKISS